jgi:hypothetical protein
MADSASSLDLLNQSAAGNSINNAASSPSLAQGGGSTGKAYDPDGKPESREQRMQSRKARIQTNRDANAHHVEGKAIVFTGAPDLLYFNLVLHGMPLLW